jgi:mRNA-degrading endonuclease RelE of RelBE toxin-antitoxin system
MAKRPGPYRLEIESRVDEELDALRAFDARPIVRAIDELEHHAELETRNRKPLRKPIADLPGASWEVRVGDYRVLYQVRKDRTVRVLGVIFKGRLTTDEALTWRRRE